MDANESFIFLILKYEKKSTILFTPFISGKKEKTKKLQRNLRHLPFGRNEL
jgi:hypothetical protein